LKVNASLPKEVEKDEAPQLNPSRYSLAERVHPTGAVQADRMFGALAVGQGRVHGRDSSAEIWKNRSRILMTILPRWSRIAVENRFQSIVGKD
jgi:hypothetical protein